MAGRPVYDEILGDQEPSKTTEMNKPKGSIDEYLASVEPGMRAALAHMRRQILEIAPDAVEVISYGMPAFKLGGRILVYFAAFSEHCSLFPGAAVVESCREELKGFKTSTGTIQFTPEHPIPDELLERIVIAKMRENAARARKKN